MFCDSKTVFEKKLSTKVRGEMIRTMFKRDSKSRQQWLIPEFVSPGPSLLWLAKIQLQVAG